MRRTRAIADLFDIPSLDLGGEIKAVSTAISVMATAISQMDHESISTIEGLAVSDRTNNVALQNK